MCSMIQCGSESTSSKEVLPDCNKYKHRNIGDSGTPEITRPFGECGVFSNDSATASVGLMILDSFSPPNEDMSFSELWYRVSQLRFRSGEALFHVLYRCFPERVVALTHVGTDYSEPWFEAINT